MTNLLYFPLGIIKFIELKQNWLDCNPIDSLRGSGYEEETPPPNNTDDLKASTKANQASIKDWLKAGILNRAFLPFSSHEKFCWIGLSFSLIVGPASCSIQGVARGD